MNLLTNASSGRPSPATRYATHSATCSEIVSRVPGARLRVLPFGNGDDMSETSAGPSGAGVHEFTVEIIEDYLDADQINLDIS